MDNPQVLPAEKAPILYEPSEAAIALIRQRYEHLPATVHTKEGEAACRKARAEVKSMRTAIEKRRKELNEDAIEWKRNVDGTAKKLTGLVLEIETPLDLAIKEVEAERERKRAAIEEAERQALLAKLKAEQEAEQARLKAIREAEEIKLAAERAELQRQRAELEAARAAEAAKRKHEQDLIDAQRKEMERVEAERLAAQRKEQEAIAAERRRLEREEAERLAAARAVEAERKRVEEELRLVVEEQQAAEAEAKRQEMLRPDVEKIHAYGHKIMALQSENPFVNSTFARSFLEPLLTDLSKLGRRCLEFTPSSAKPISDKFKRG